MGRPLWFVKLIKKSFPRIKIIARLTKIPIIGKLFEFFLFEGDVLIYLTKDKIISVNQSVEKPQEMVLPSAIVEYFINKAKYHWIMNTCICRESMSCKNYPINLGCLFLGEAVLGINPKLGRLVSKQEALEHVKKCRDAGLIHMIGKNKLDMQWLGVKPGEKLLTICNCDPCCCLWRILPFVSRDIGSKVKKMDGVYVKVNQNCVGCGICTTGVCFVDAIHLHGNIAQINENCRGCGRCVEICPQNAIELSVMDNEFIKKSIKKIEKVIKLT
ncbi:MAG: DUF362 domain-containing protein [Promethearchaeota archaeon]